MYAAYLFVKNKTIMNKEKGFHNMMFLFRVLAAVPLASRGSIFEGIKKDRKIA